MNNELSSSSAGQGMGISSLVLGIVAIICAFIPCFGLIAVIFGVLAIIFGAIGMSQAKRGKAPNTMPKAGLILGIVATAFVVIWVSVVIGSIGSSILTQKDDFIKSADSIKLQDSLNKIEIDSTRDKKMEK
ncbi:DUF4190 domain-containing protein [Flavobacterium artemisiae]|uniref:DUF4190 domain-containing protein n=1 Tax=Flavobacterium artemisiae TaxID=2126556 RepID=A0ABW4HHI2_9FLAO